MKFCAVACWHRTTLKQREALSSSLALSSADLRFSENSWNLGLWPCVRPTWPKTSWALEPHCTCWRSVSSKLWRRNLPRETYSSPTAECCVLDMTKLGESQLWCCSERDKQPMPRSKCQESVHFLSSSSSRALSPLAWTNRWNSFPATVGVDAIR